MALKDKLMGTIAGTLALGLVGCTYTPVKTNDISVNDFSCCNPGATVYTNGLNAVVIDEEGGLALEEAGFWRKSTAQDAGLENYLADGTIAKQLKSIDPKTGEERIEATLLQNNKGLELYFERTGAKYTVDSPMSEQPKNGGGGSGGGGAGGSV
jgi:hypothetical protein